MPPMDALGGDGMGVPEIPNEPNPNDMSNMPQDMGGNGMDDNMMGDGFDASVEANPEEDPKKYIQQLSGKLSQELRKYNEEQPNPDEDLNKYVAGMLIPQASKGLTDKGKNEIIKKIKNGSVDAENDDETMQTESLNPCLDNFDNKRRNQGKICNKTLPKNSPFRSNR